MPRPLLRLFVQCLLAHMLVVLSALAPTYAIEPLQLVDEAVDVDPWPWMSVLDDPLATLSVEQALDQLDRFAPPPSLRSSFGTQRGAKWLWIPIRIRAGDTGRWILNIDYPLLDHISVYQVAGNQARLLGELGDSRPVSSKPLPVRAHAIDVQFDTSTGGSDSSASSGSGSGSGSGSSSGSDASSLSGPALSSAAGNAQGLLLRVASTSTMIVPLRLTKMPALLATEQDSQFYLGLASGFHACLVAFCAFAWLLLRERILIGYAATVLGIAVYLFAYSGLGAQHVWGDNPWLTHHIPMIAIMLSVWGQFIFLDEALMLRSRHPTLGRIAEAWSLAAIVMAVLFAMDIIGYAGATLAAGMAAATLFALGGPVSVSLARRGDLAARFVLIGWVGYVLGVVTMLLMVRGFLPATPLTMHALHAGASFEAFMWMMVLAVRVDQIRRQARGISTERDQLRSLANTDSLTGLPNRRGLYATLERELAASGPDRHVAVYMLDLDGFKPINDQHGHETGDVVLQRLAERLSNRIRAGDTVARLGGDEFIVVARSLHNLDEATLIGDKLLETFEQPFTVDALQLRVGVTIGYALAPSDGVEAGSLLRLADQAMYKGKVSGRGRLLRCEPTA